jgi:peptidyl-tRNA hydrolase, PTH1 family
MNLSGQSIRMALDFYKIPLANLLLICDDLSLEVGRLRLRSEGSAGGQKGLANTIEQLGSDRFPRLRIGIGQPPASLSAADYVLRRFLPNERTEVDLAVKRAADAVEVWVKDGIAAAMNRFNADPNADPKRKPKASPKGKTEQQNVARSESQEPSSEMGNKGSGQGLYPPPPGNV